MTVVPAGGNARHLYDRNGTFHHFSCDSRAIIMDVGVLISLVQNYPELYNMRHPDYFNNIRRDNCWEEIAGIMKQTSKFS